MRFLSLGVSVALLLAAASAPGAETVALRDAVVVDGPSCVEAEALVSDLAVWLARDAIDSRIRILVHNEAEHFLTFEVRRDGRAIGERRLGGGMTCPKLRAVVALAVATAVDATVLGSMPAPIPPSPAETPPVERPPPPSPPPPKAERLEVDAEVLLLVGVMPLALLGGEIGVGYRLTPWFESRVAFLGTTSESFTLGNGATSAHLLAGRAEGCLVNGDALLRVHACLGLAAGAMPAAGADLAQNFSVSPPWAAAAAHVESEFRLARAFGLIFGADGFVPFVVPSFEAVGVGGSPAVQRRVPGAGFALRAGIVLGFL
jgi:hypothetical protein